jgi:hypothetical protein
MSESNSGLTARIDKTLAEIRQVGLLFGLSDQNLARLINELADEIRDLRASMAGESRERLDDAQSRLNGMESVCRQLWEETRRRQGRTEPRPQLLLLRAWPELT